MDAEKPARYRILIADDSEVCCVLLAMVLRKTDHDVHCVYDGVQALEALRNERFDLVILDQEMPKLDGLGALAVIRIIQPRLPVVVCSGSITEEQARRYERLGVTIIVKKPVDPLRLRGIVNEIMERTEQHAEVLSNEPWSSRPEAGAGGIPASVVADRILQEPAFLGVSPAARKLTADFRRVRKFKSAALVEGYPGGAFLDVAVAMAESSEGLTNVCAAEEVSGPHLHALIAPARGRGQPLSLIVTQADRLAPEQQHLLVALLAESGGAAGGGAAAFRLILCAETSLCELADAGEFDERLLLRAAAMSVKLPDFPEQRGDLGLIGQGVLRRIGLSRVGLTAEAQDWLERQEWPEGYMQMHRTIEIASTYLGTARNMTAEHLARARVCEPAEDGPLFHDLMVESLREEMALRGEG